MEKELRLEDLLQILKKNLLFIILFSLITGGGAFCVSYFYVEKKYESSALIYVQNNTNISDATGLNINDITASQKLVNTCQIIFRSDTMMEKIKDALNLKYTTDELKTMITAQSVNNTEVMRITATSKSRYEAADIINTMLKLADEEFQRIIKTGDFEIVDYGRVSDEPSFPNIPLFTVIGFAAGFLLAYAFIFLVEMLNVVIKHNDDITKLYDIPIFAEIPVFEVEAGKKYVFDYLSGQNTIMPPGKYNLSTTEAYNAGRTNVMFSVAPLDNKIIVFSSCNPSEGKSVTSVNMSVAFAKAGFRTLLIDCDMRKPTISYYFDVDNNNGLSSVLGGFCMIGEAINREVTPNLDVIAAGDIPPNPSELLTSSSMLELLETSKNHYDFIFLDTPPLNIFSDALLVNDIIAGIVFIVKENSTTHPDLQKAISSVSLAKGRMLGIIKNFCVSAPKKYGKEYVYRGYDYSKR
jgi:capsular exopolysaccharide synthesis family protein